MADKNGENGENGESEASVTLTEREIKVLACAFQCLKTPPDVDFDKLAPLLNMTNTRSASNALYAVRRRLNAIVPPCGAPKSGAPATPKKGRPTKREKEDAVGAGKAGPAREVKQEDEDDEEGVEASPTKKARVVGGKKAGAAAGKAKGKAARKVGSSNDDDGELA